MRRAGKGKHETACDGGYGSSICTCDHRLSRGRGSALVTSDDHFQRVMSEMRIKAGLQAMEKAKDYMNGLEVGDMFIGLRPAAERFGYTDPESIEQRCFVTEGLSHLRHWVIYTDINGRITYLQKERRAGAK